MLFSRSNVSQMSESSVSNSNFGSSSALNDQQERQSKKTSQNGSKPSFPRRQRIVLGNNFAACISATTKPLNSVYFSPNGNGMFQQQPETKEEAYKPDISVYGELTRKTQKVEALARTNSEVSVNVGEQ